MLMPMEKKPSVKILLICQI